MRKNWNLHIYAQYWNYFAEVTKCKFSFPKNPFFCFRVFWANQRHFNSVVGDFLYPLSVSLHISKGKLVFVTCVTFSSLSSLLHDRCHQAIENIQERWSRFQHHLVRNRHVGSMSSSVFSLSSSVFSLYNLIEAPHQFFACCCPLQVWWVYPAIVFNKLGFDTTLNRFKYLDCDIKGTAIYSSLTRNEKNIHDCRQY